MNTRWFLLPAALLALSLMIGCQTKDPIRKITETDNGSTITIAHNDLLEVDLQGNPNTGFTWQTVNINSWVLAPLKRPLFVAAPAGTNVQPPVGALATNVQPLVGSPGTNVPPLLGAGGTVTLTYQAVGAGTSPLQLAYSRPWQTNAAPARDFAITVIVK